MLRGCSDRKHKTVYPTQGHDRCKAGNSAIDWGEAGRVFTRGFGPALSNQVVIFLLSASLHGWG